QLAKLGIDFTARSILLQYSRQAESEADSNGVRILYDAGYDPAGLARFFVKLDQAGNQPHGRLATFLSDHPSPSNRIQAIDAEIRDLPTRRYSESNVKEFARLKNAVAALPAPARRPGGDAR
ncbi:MAG TPA: M48 family metalloprotease, partial [Bryobacteraceae bacterium]|nr:M48 family metalloprotease [Bryobacteraceae bacterium]